MNQLTVYATGSVHVLINGTPDVGHRRLPGLAAAMLGHCREAGDVLADAVGEVEHDAPNGPHHLRVRLGHGDAGRVAGLIRELDVVAAAHVGCAPDHPDDAPAGPIVLPRSVAVNRKLPAGAKLIYAALGSRSDASGIAEVSGVDLALDTGLSASAVRSGLRRLRSAGLLGGTAYRPGYPNRYYLNERPTPEEVPW